LDGSLPHNLLKLLNVLLPSPTTIQLRKEGVHLYALVLSSLELVVSSAAYQEESQAGAEAVQKLRTFLHQPGPDGAPGEQLQLEKALTQTQVMGR
jgi:hypothetical protein